MTFDQLCEVYQTAAFALPDKGGLRAVVEALRDELCERGQHFAWDAYDTSDWFDDILGDAGEKAAGTATSADSSAPRPAADPSEVCEWTRHKSNVGIITPSCSNEDAYVGASDPKFCPDCGKPIIFKEK